MKRMPHRSHGRTDFSRYTARIASGFVRWGGVKRKRRQFEVVKRLTFIMRVFANDKKAFL